jgi:hypothetical protein
LTVPSRSPPIRKVQVALKTQSCLLRSAPPLHGVHFCQSAADTSTTAAKTMFVAGVGRTHRRKFVSRRSARRSRGLRPKRFQREFTSAVAVGTALAGGPPQLGRAEARTGLRMMPTFPRPSRSFRTAGCPQYGWKAGLSDSVFPDQHQVKPAPGIPRRQSGLRPPFVDSVVKFGTPARCRADDSVIHRRGGLSSPPPQGPSLGTGL